MQSITFDQFKSGLDLRKSIYTAGADSMRRLDNCRITAGYEIEKRGCLTAVQEVPSDVAGPAVSNNILTYFTASAPPSLPYGDDLLIVKSYDSAVRPLTGVRYCSMFQGFPFLVLEFDDRYIEWCYIDSEVWDELSAYPTVGTIVHPTVQNGYRYLVDSIASGGAIPLGVEPTWPTTIGATVVQAGVGPGTTTWKCYAYKITDANCPHSDSAAIVANKIYGVTLDANDVGIAPYCATASARDWTTSSNAGFLPVYNQQGAVGRLVGVGEHHGKKLLVYFEDSVQIWSADPDPDLTVISSSILTSGTVFPRASGQVGSDTFYLSRGGFRSVTLNSLVEVSEESDIGSPIDSLVREQFSGNVDDAIALWLNDPGQYICIVDGTAYVYSSSRTSKLGSWSRYFYPGQPDDMCIYQGKLWMRIGQDVYYLDPDTHQDDEDPPECVVEFPLLDCKSPGTLKMFQALDFVGTGSATIEFDYLNDQGVLHTSDALDVANFTMPGVLTPMELCAVAVAPRIRHRANERFSINRLTFYYQQLGAD